LGPSGIIHGQDDIDANLSDQAALDACRITLPKKAVWLNSGLPRTIQTAEALGGHNCREVSGLMEQNFGEWNGRSWSDIRGDEAQEFWKNFVTQAPPGGESFICMVDRISNTISELSIEYEGHDIVAVGHSGTIRSALAMALNLFAKSALTFHINNLSLTQIESISDGEDIAWSVHGVNR
jgi:alpha-ribazole phosphatase